MYRSHSIIFFASSVILSTLTSAQFPVPVCCMSYAHIEETTLYIHGGLDANRIPTNQFIALDLTVPSWEIFFPPWSTPPSKPLHLNGSPAPPTSIWHSMAVAKDREKLLIWDALHTDGNWWWTYNILEKTWSNFSIILDTSEIAATNPLVLVNVTHQAGIRNGVDLTSGDVFISSGTSDGVQMIQHTVNATSGLPRTSQPTSFRQDPIAHASFVWSMYRNSFLHYGGRSMFGNTSNPNLNELIPKYGWDPVVRFFLGWMSLFFFFCMFTGY